MNINIYPNPWDLRYFQEIAHTGNLSRAAERLGVGQPALSLSLKRLEEALEVELFLRRNRGLILTAAGQRLLRESNRLLSAWESVVSETRKSETEMIGRFTLGCHPSVAIYALKNIVREIYESHSGIEIQLVHDLSRNVCEGVISGKIDFGIVVNPVRHPDLVIRKLATDDVCFWKSPKGLENVLIYDPTLIQSRALLKKIHLNAHFDRCITSDNLEVIAMLAGSGAGVAILPGRVVKALSPGLRKLERFSSFLDEITFIYRADLPKTSSSEYLLSRLRSLEI
jgi:LysR family transcriptional regulator, cell division regulator